MYQNFRLLTNWLVSGPFLANFWPVLSPFVCLLGPVWALLGRFWPHHTPEERGNHQPQPNAGSYRRLGGKYRSLVTIVAWG